MKRLYLGPAAAKMTVKEWRQEFIAEAMSIADDIVAYSFTQALWTAEKNDAMARVNEREVRKYLKALKKLLKQTVLRRIAREHIDDDTASPHLRPGRIEEVNENEQ